MGGGEHPDSEGGGVRFRMLSRLKPIKRSDGGGIVLGFIDFFNVVK